MADVVVQIDIEVSTHSEKELNEILNKIDRGEQKLSKIKEQRRRAQMLRGGGAPSDIGVGQEEDERGGIFGGQILGEATPGGKPRDTTSKEPVQRENVIKQIEERQSNIERALGLGKSVGGGLALIGGGKDPVEKVMGIITKIPGAITIIAGILIAKGIFDFIIEELFRPGGIFDRRFLPKLKGIVSNLTSRREKAEINAGLRTVIVTSSQNLRSGRGQVVSTQKFVNRGGVYENRLEQTAKGI